MTEEYLSPMQRIFLAFVAFFAVLFRREFALAVRDLREKQRVGLPPGDAYSTGEPAAIPKPVTSAPAVHREETVPVTPSPAEPRTTAPVTPSPAEPGKKVPVSVAPAPAVAREERVGPRGTNAAAGSVVPAPAPVAAPAPAPAPAARATVEADRAPDPRPALVLLSSLQREGRLVDFIEEDLTGFSDSEIGAAARTVHAGCKRAIESWFRLEPVYAQPEGAAITVERGFDPSAVRLTGNVVGDPPFKGALRHHGWKARDVKVPWPTDGRDPKIVAPAEVEL
jgi:hypothetical protein